MGGVDVDSCSKALGIMRVRIMSRIKNNEGQIPINIPGLLHQKWHFQANLLMF